MSWVSRSTKNGNIAIEIAKKHYKVMKELDEKIVKEFFRKTKRPTLQDLMYLERIIVGDHELNFTFNALHRKLLVKERK